MDGGVTLGAKESSEKTNDCIFSGSDGEEEVKMGVTSLGDKSYGQEPVHWSIFEPEIKIEEVPLSGDENDNDAAALQKAEDENQVACPICEKFYFTASALKGHVTKVHGTSVGTDKFVCHICGAAGSSRNSLKRHLRRTHKSEAIEHPALLTKKCLHCGSCFSSQPLLYEHLRASHETQLSHYYRCRWCPALMRAKASLQRHIRRAHPSESSVEAPVASCSMCQSSFASRFMLQRHLRQNHPGSLYHGCQLCPAKFKYLSMLSRHIKLSHGKPDNGNRTRKRKCATMACADCGLKFTSKPRLDAHAKSEHSKNNNEENPPSPQLLKTARHKRKARRDRQKVRCAKCDLTFASPQECAAHRRQHPIACAVCQKQFLRRDSLREHMLIHSAPRHQCPHCHKKFTQRSNLKRHIRVHTGEKPYKCRFCERRFGDKSACNSHMRVHTGHGRCVCDHCGASFSKKQRLNYHLRTHTGDGLLYCPVCARPATNSYSLRKHVDTHKLPIAKALGDELIGGEAFVAKALEALTQAALQSGRQRDRVNHAGKNISDEGAEKGVEEDKGEDVSGNEEARENESGVRLMRLLQAGLLQEGHEMGKAAISDRQRRRRKRERKIKKTHIEEADGMGEDASCTFEEDLVRGCLQVIMQDGSPHNTEHELKTTTYENITSPLSHEEMPSNITDGDVLLDEATAVDDPSEVTVRTIPKIKICRIPNQHSDVTDVAPFFISEIIKN